LVDACVTKGQATDVLRQEVERVIGMPPKKQPLEERVRRAQEQAMRLKRAQ